MRSAEVNKNIDMDQLDKGKYFDNLAWTGCLDI